MPQAIKTLPNFANPSASLGLTAVNGTASTAMRSDGAPALDQSIAPTWTGAHTFTNATPITISSTNPKIVLTDTTASAKGLTIDVDSNRADFRESAGAAASLLLLDLANNRLGIGVAPNAGFHYAGTTAIFGSGESGTPVAVTLRGPAASGTDIAGANVTIDASNGTGTGGSGAIVFRTAPAGTTGTSANTFSEIARITKTGYFGIGTNNPTLGTLTISNSAADPATNKCGILSTQSITLSGNTANSAYAGDFAANGSTSAFNFGTLSAIRAIATAQSTGGTLSNATGLNGIAQTTTACTGTISQLYGLAFDVKHFGTGTVTEANGITATCDLRVNGGAADGNITTGRGLSLRILNRGTAATPGIIATGIGADVITPFFGTTGTITNLHGVRIQNQGNALITSSCGLSIASPTNSTNNTTALFGTVTLQSGQHHIYSVQGTITASIPAFESTATWNSGGTTFTHLFANVTDTASAAASKLLDLQVGGVTKFSIIKNGTIGTAVLSILSTGGVGYATGAGGTVTQATSRTTGVTLSKVCGAITTDTTSLAAGASATFTVTNTTVAATDTIVLSINSGQTNKETDVIVSRVAASAFDITVHNQHASVAETGAIVINFAVVKAVAA